MWQVHQNAVFLFGQQRKTHWPRVLKPHSPLQTVKVSCRNVTHHMIYSTRPGWIFRGFHAHWWGQPMDVDPIWRHYIRNSMELQAKEGTLCGCAAMWWCLGQLLSCFQVNLSKRCIKFGSNVSGWIKMMVQGLDNGRQFSLAFSPWQESPEHAVEGWNYVALST